MARSKKVQTKSKPQLNEKCDYKTGPCEGMKKLCSFDNGGRGRGIIALNNVVNMRNPSKMYHKGFFLRSDATKRGSKNPGMMLNFCPWCGSDLQEWQRQFSKDYTADGKSFDEANPDYEDRLKEAQAEIEKERQEFLEGLDPKVRKTVSKLSEKQQEALQEAWMTDGRFLHGSGVHHSTIESLKNPERKLVDGSHLTDFGKKVREALCEMY